MQRFLSGLWTLILWVGALGLLGYALLALAPINHRYPDLLLQFARPMLPVMIAALFAFALLRHIGPVLITAAACGLLIMALSPFGHIDQPARPGDMRLYVSNTWVGNDDVQRLSSSIREADADIVVLIELGETVDANLDSILGEYAYRAETPMIPGRSGASRSLIASRWPVTEIQRDIADGLPVVAARVDTPEGPLRVFGVHLTRPWPYRPSTAQTWQLERLFNRIGPAPVRTLAAGDFNSSPPSRAISHALRWSGLELISGAHGSWPNFAPRPFRIAIDHALASPDIEPVASRLGAPTGSDHLPVIVDFRLGAPEPRLAPAVAQN